MDTLDEMNVELSLHWMVKELNPLVEDGEVRKAIRGMHQRALRTNRQSASIALGFVPELVRVGMFR